jgi:hypothetical protein
MHDNSTVEVFPVAVLVRQAVKLFFTDPGFDNKIGRFQAESHGSIIAPATQPICHAVFAYSWLKCLDRACSLSR